MGNLSVTKNNIGLQISWLSFVPIIDQYLVKF